MGGHGEGLRVIALLAFDQQHRREEIQQAEAEMVVDHEMVWHLHEVGGFPGGHLGDDAPYLGALPVVQPLIEVVVVEELHEVRRLRVGAFLVVQRATQRPQVVLLKPRPLLDMVDHGLDLGGLRRELRGQLLAEHRVLDDQRVERAFRVLLQLPQLAEGNRRLVAQLDLLPDQHDVLRAEVNSRMNSRSWNF